MFLSNAKVAKYKYLNKRTKNKKNPEINVHFKQHIIAPSAHDRWICYQGRDINDEQVTIR